MRRLRSQEDVISGPRKPHDHLVVVRLSAMGDAALLAPVLNALLKQHPTLKVSFLSLEKWRPIFKDLPRLHFIAAQTKGKHKGILGLWKLAGELKALQPTAIADLHYVLRSRLIRLFLSPLQLPTAVIDKGREEKKALTRPTNKVFKPLKHTAERYAIALKAVGFPTVLDKDALLTKPLAAQNKTGLVIGVAPFAAHAGKQYPLAKMKEALRIFEENMAEKDIKYQLVFFGGGPVEQPLIEQLCKDFPRSSHALDLSFEEELTEIAHLDLMVAMDSGNAHLAAMYGVPTITLWGNTHPYAGFYPFLQDPENALLADRGQYPLLPSSVFGKKVPKGYENVMESIAPEKVAQKMQSLLEKTS